MEAQGVAVWRLYIGDGMWRGSCSAEARYCERTGRRTETESGGPGGTRPQHRIKSSIHYRPGRPDVSFVSVLTSRIAGYVIRMSGGVGGALSDGCPYPYRQLLFLIGVIMKNQNKATEVEDGTDPPMSALTHMLGSSSFFFFFC